MAEDAVAVSQSQTKPIKIKKWKIQEGTTVSVGRVILTYEFAEAEKPEQRKLKSKRAGIIVKILAEEGTVVQPGQSLYEIKACSHPTIMNDMCAECGADLQKDDTLKGTASVPMIHAIPDLKVSEELAQKLGQADSERLLKDRKLVLLVDLDQTLIHTTNDNIPPNIKDVYHFQLYGPKSPWYHTRLRPGTHKFLESICQYYELHICTFGARNYAHMIAMFLDPDQKFFSNRILSRDECFVPTSKKANLRALFPCGDDLVCIIDDREDVWSHATNLIHVKPYHFFQHTGDINAPPGLDKHDADDKEGVDLTKLIKNSSEKSQAEKSCESIESIADEEIKEVVENDNTIIEEIDSPNEENNEAESGEENKDRSDISEENKLKEEVEPIVDKNEDSKIEWKSEGTSLKSMEITEVNNEKLEIVEADSTEHAETNKETDNLEQPSCEISNGKLKISSEPEVSKQPQQDSKEGDFIVIEDPDDYLAYLEDVLKNIHSSYYELYDRMESGKIPDLKKVIPYVKSRILKSCKLVFSGLVPTHCKLEKSKAYQLARSLGAEVQGEIDDDTTHLVAVRPGTLKVNAGRKKKNLKIVTPDWLWCCAERWEKVDERVFPLNAKGSKNRHPPPHCSSPEHVPSYPEHDTPALRKRTPSGRFMDTINPLMSFSSDDIADMDKEVEDILDDDTDDSEEEKKMIANDVNIEGGEADEEDTDIEEANFNHMVQTEILDTYDVQQDDGEREAAKNSLETDENEFNETVDDVEEHNSRKRRHEEDENSQDVPSVKFRRGEDVDELDIDQALQDPDDNDSDSFESPDEEDEGEWNIMGQALEREFLSD
ncbi:RNA polymerase II subunit A C-terminal domain phosphatase isoform X1 [Euwallacea fornicatus]|uniref:RNA polymerase II subunit A C-terminal domain phosphatase isoform X1 n=1 Tax=Euwallacea fornicatus TaxID=995702 RepID=UPI00338F4A87